MSEQKAEQAGWDDFELPSGRKARIMRQRKGHHLEKALRVAGKEAQNAATMSFALASILCVVDDAPFTIEDVREWSIEDAGAIMAKVNEGKAVASSVSDS